MHETSEHYHSGDDLSFRYGVTSDSLRYYEELGLICPVRVGSKSFYTAKDCVRLELILKGKRLGFSLAEIALLIDRAANAASRDERQAD